MNVSFELIDLVLLAVVTAMSVAVAYISSPRIKSMVYMLPFPFSIALISTGKGVDATHMIGFGLVWAFLWIVWFLHTRMRVPILFANGAAIVFHSIVSVVIATYTPHPDAVSVQAVVFENRLFWGAAGVISLLAVAGLCLPHHQETPYRSLMHPAIKIPLVFVLIAMIVMSKNFLRGFMPSFPMVTVFAVYEARYSLYTMASSMPVFLLGCVPLLVVCRLVIPYHPESTAIMIKGLAAGWLLYVPIYLMMAKIYKKRESLCGKPQGV